jgi:hypothetical protein
MEGTNRVKVALEAGQTSMGLWQMIPGANISRLLANSGPDWVCVDCEHGNIDGAHFPAYIEVPSDVVTDMGDGMSRLGDARRRASHCRSWRIAACPDSGYAGMDGQT